MPYFPNVSIFLLTAQDGLPENPGVCPKTAIWIFWTKTVFLLKIGWQPC